MTKIAEPSAETLAQAIGGSLAAIDALIMTVQPGVYRVQRAAEAVGGQVPPSDRPLLEHRQYQ